MERFRQRREGGMAAWGGSGRRWKPTKTWKDRDQATTSHDHSNHPGLYQNHLAQTVRHNTSHITSRDIIMRDVSRWLLYSLVVVSIYFLWWSNGEVMGVIARVSLACWLVRLVLVRSWVVAMIIFGGYLDCQGGCLGITRWLVWCPKLLLG